MARWMLLAIGFVLAGTAAAPAQPTGVYIGGALGGNFAADSKSKQNAEGVGNPSRPIGVDIGFATGLVGAASLGYATGYGLRAEVEASFRNNDASGSRFYIQGLPNNGVSARGGGLRSFGLMVNLLHDIDMAALGLAGSRIRPYVGGGIGWVSTDFRRMTGAFEGTGYELSLAGTRSSLGYQGILGAAMPVEAVPGLAVTAEYRYFGTASQPLRGALRYTASGQTSTLGTYKVSPDLSSHSVMLGLRYTLDRPGEAGVAANLPVGWTAPPAQPAAAVARTYVVYFGPGSAALDAEARRIVNEAADSARSLQTTKIELQARADNTGAAAPNRRLAEDRAQAVMRELSRLGIPAGMISTLASGSEGEPRGENSRARRVDILLR